MIGTSPIKANGSIKIDLGNGGTGSRASVLLESEPKL